MDDLDIRIMIAIAASLTIVGNTCRAAADVQLSRHVRDAKGQKLSLRERNWRDIVKGIGYAASIIAGLLALAGSILLVP